MENYQIFIGCEQPATCPYCGNRTKIIDENEEFQLHSCLAISCAAQFILEFEPEP